MLRGEHQNCLALLQVGGQAEEVAQAITHMQGESTSFRIEGWKDTALAITAVVDPLSKVAQQLSNALDFLRKTLQPNIQAQPS